MFCATVFHGKSANCWNTTERSGPGPVTGFPATVTDPDVEIPGPRPSAGRSSCHILTDRQSPRIPWREPRSLNPRPPADPSHPAESIALRDRTQYYSSRAKDHLQRRDDRRLLQYVMWLTSSRTDALTA